MDHFPWQYLPSRPGSPPCQGNWAGTAGTGLGDSSVSWVTVCVLGDSSVSWVARTHPPAPALCKGRGERKREGTPGAHPAISCPSSCCAGVAWMLCHLLLGVSHLRAVTSNLCSGDRAHRGSAMGYWGEILPCKGGGSGMGSL